MSRKLSNTNINFPLLLFHSKENMDFHLHFGMKNENKRRTPHNEEKKNRKIKANKENGKKPQEANKNNNKIELNDKMISSLFLQSGKSPTRLCGFISERPRMFSQKYNDSPIKSLQLACNIIEDNSNLGSFPPTSRFYSISCSSSFT